MRRVTRGKMLGDSHFQSRADSDKLAQAIKRELAKRVWAESDDHLDSRRYLSLFMANPVPMWIYDVETLAILDVNESAVARYGYSREEFLCLTVRDIRPREDVAKFMELTTALPNSDRTGPWRHVLRDGTTIQVLITSHALTFANHHARLVMAEQIIDGSEIDIG